MESALKNFRSGDWNRGLLELNALWVTTRCPGVAAQIERLSAHALAQYPPLEGKNKDLQTAWEKRWAQGDAAGVERLLEVMRNGTVKQLRARFLRLLDKDPDPRMTKVVPLFASELHLRGASSSPVWTAFFKLIVHTGDPRALPYLEQLARLAQASMDAEWDYVE